MKRRPKYIDDIRAALTGLIAFPKTSGDKEVLTSITIHYADEIRRQLAARKGEK